MMTPGLCVTSQIICLNSSASFFLYFLSSYLMLPSELRDRISHANWPHPSLPLYLSSPPCREVSHLLHAPGFHFDHTKPENCIERTSGELQAVIFNVALTSSSQRVHRRESLVCYQPSDASPRGRQTAVACCYRLRLNGPSASCGLSARHQVCVGAVPFVPPFAPSHIFARRSVCRHRYIDRCADGRTSGVRISSGSHRLAVNGCCCCCMLWQRRSLMNDALFASSPQTAALRRLLPSTRPVFRAAASLPAISETICTRRQTHAAARSERGVVCNEIAYGNLKRIYMHRLT